MKLNTLSPFKARKKRVGRGHSAGQGKTSGRGHKGQKARTGKKLRPGFEGGQTPIFQRLPKYRGFKNPNHVVYQIVNIETLEKLKTKTVTNESLFEAGLIAKKNQPVKILGDGALSKALEIRVEKASESAVKKITDAGGSFTSTVGEAPAMSEEKSEEKPAAKKAVKKKTKAKE